jgi:predicted HNH restriction endonuclease
MAVKKPRKEYTTNAMVRAVLRRFWLRSNERSAALKRTGYCCAKCGVKQSKAKGKEQKIEVHHVEGIDWDGLCDLVRERMLQSPDKLMPLCPNCHKETHHAG